MRNFRYLIAMLDRWSVTVRILTNASNNSNFYFDWLTDNIVNFAVSYLKNSLLNTEELQKKVYNLTFKFCYSDR